MKPPFSGIYTFSLQNQTFVCKEGSLIAVRFPFVRGGIPVPDVLCGLSLLPAGSMRFRWDECNPRRNAFFASCGIAPSAVCPLELIHSRTVYTDYSYTTGVSGDGLLTQHPQAQTVLSVTVADCMPIYLYDPVSGVRGMLHSGWKGTGIVRTALQEAAAVYGVRAENVCAVIGSHIRSCCYSVDAERASYFRAQFTPDCVSARPCTDNAAFPFMLSLEKANLALLRECGVRPENIAVCTDCTCCAKTAAAGAEPGSPFLGSYRRQTAPFPSSVSAEERSLQFTVMAAFV